MPSAVTSTRTVTVSPSAATCSASTSTLTTTVAASGLTCTAATSTLTRTVTLSASAPPSTSSSSTSGSSSSATSPTITSSSASSTSSSSSGSNTNPTVTLTATQTNTRTGLNAAATSIGKLWFGTAADIPGTGEAADYYYTQEFNNTLDFGEATPANIMKYEFTEPQPGVFDFSGSDYFLAFVKATGKQVRCHNLICTQELPTWITSPTVPWTNATLSAALYRHVYTLVTYFGDQCYSWDVVNEAFSDASNVTYSDNVWLANIGPSYVQMAFQAATDAVRNNSLAVKLYYNDYNIEYPGYKATRAQNLVTSLKSQNIQIDGIGLESHFIAGSTPSRATQAANMAAFVALGVEVAVTELDVRLNLPPTVASETQQVTDYYNTVGACVDTPRCVGVVVWDFVDTYSWVPSTFPGQGYADLFLQPGGANTTLVKKAAYDGCFQALTGQAVGLKM
ncbi:glycoside hydrolase family 10 protein [Baudoinia panamericana UAMH 10762]|uniref:Beta-xylanase n=1 Tax=Baudoinia panamericana (strain UAMH 10762) TaxID=717646 RepID=M2N4K1_BAUPA|nr:glycoside hydrolase family 10 protein [Baudoinia panamericana UAMH 10762]EMC93939.1 glycoside hydrolase family 10 protein [Baudoinia panamericana UAMH 10762]